MEVPLQIGMNGSKIDSAILIWPDNTYEKLNLQKGQKAKVAYIKGLPVYHYASQRDPDPIYTVKNITGETGINFLHKENPLPEIDREPLMPHMVSTEGPALSVDDLDRCGPGAKCQASSRRI